MTMWFMVIQVIWALPRGGEIKDDEVLSKIEFRTNKRPSSLKTADD